jgi:tRNA (guanine-N7-)-methyltransferase
MIEPREPNPFVLDLKGRTPPLRWEEVFPVPVRSVEVELGSGKGMFLRRESAGRPDVGFLGVERAGKFFELCARRIERDGRANVRLTRADAFDLLARWLPAAGIAVLHVYFPDPWPKKRHAKRRMLTPPLFDLAARTIESGGCLSIATDVTPYFGEATATLDAHPCFARMELPEGAIASVATNYALKYAREGRALHLARYRRTPESAPPAPNPLRLRFLADRSPSPASADGP